jgi:hypothetical protein
MKKLIVAFRNFVNAPENRQMKEVYMRNMNVHLKSHIEQKMDLHCVENWWAE